MPIMENQGAPLSASAPVQPKHSGSVFDRIRGGLNVKVCDLAPAIGITSGGLYRAVREKEVEAITIGRVVFIPAHEAMRLLGMRPEHRAA